ncbi:hypothetical protein FRC02_012378 [Tulasnella sp. 418]|nr:hypothetical protein FRC02_012378 [Tulasnella sp. 418]
MDLRSAHGVLPREAKYSRVLGVIWHATQIEKWCSVWAVLALLEMDHAEYHASNEDVWFTHQDGRSSLSPLSPAKSTLGTAADTLHWLSVYFVGIVVVCGRLPFVSVQILTFTAPRR